MSGNMFEFKKALKFLRKVVGIDLIQSVNFSCYMCAELKNSLSLNCELTGHLKKMSGLSIRVFEIKTILENTTNEKTRPLLL